MQNFELASFLLLNRQHISLIRGALANEMMVLRWLHLVFGVMWIGLLYFFNLVLTPAMKACDPKLRVKIYPELMPRAMAWFRWSALVTVLVGLRYFYIYLSSDGRSVGPHRAFHWFAEWLVVWLVAYALLYALQLPAKGSFLDHAAVRVVGIAAVVIAASWLILVLQEGPTSTSAHLAISVGGGLGLLMLLNTWGIVWRAQKRLIAWTRAANEQGTPMPAEAEYMMRWTFLAARTGFWLSFPMLFLMGAASHYPMFG
ncbi:MAG TPA: hypothetical protein VOA78_06685 [Candidatus Dormibacteraeota bacterium]|nr:hypothetical protein [Candidatus Dormibacteraeota bacterium]